MRSTQALLRRAGAIAHDCQAKAVFQYADAIRSRPSAEADFGTKVIQIVKTQSEEEELRGCRQCWIRVPNVKLSRFGQIKIAMFLTLSSGLIARDDVVVCLPGPSADQPIDTLFVTVAGDEFENLADVRDDDHLSEGVSAEAVERIIDIAAELGSEGREGKGVGALFVIGDAQRVISLSKQLITNPFRGYAEEERSILDPALEETVKELSTIDGAFIIRGDGAIKMCGA